MSRSSKLINALIKGISTRSAKQRSDIQTALIECAMFVFEDRNTDPAKRLFAAVGGETHRAGMSKWLSLNGAVHFKDGAPLLSDERQKELTGSMLAAEYEAQIRAMPAWFDMDEDNNKAINVWDTAAQIKKFDDYFLSFIKRVGKHDMDMAAMLDRSHSLFRAELERVATVTEVAAGAESVAAQ
jgi:hypothetical protein